MINAAYSASATSAIRALKDINSALDQTQNRISTGFKVNSAKDNPNVWQAATSLRSEIKSYDVTKGTLDSAKTIFDTASIAADQVANLLGQLKTALTSGMSTTAATTARTEADATVLALQNQIKAVVADAKVQGVNLLDAGTSPTVTTSFSTNGTTTTAAFTSIDIDTTTLGTTNAAAFGTGFSILTATITAAVDSSLAATAFDTAIKAVSDYSVQLSGASSRISSTQDLMQKMSDIKKTALGTLVDADLAEESALLSALQVKQQLATQALSIANSSGQNILRLFQ